MCVADFKSDGIYGVDSDDVWVLGESSGGNVIIVWCLCVAGTFACNHIIAVL